jgi:hypothetical protein
MSDRASEEAGPELALLAHAYGWEPRVIEALSQRQLVYYLRWIPLIEARRGWGSASLEAALLNVVGGKPDPSADSEADNPPLPPSRLFTPEERPPPWARLETGPGVWTARSARDALEHAHQLPVGALAILDFDRLERIATT